MSEQSTPLNNAKRIPSRPPLPEGWTYLSGDAETYFSQVEHAATEVGAQFSRFGGATINILSPSPLAYKADVLDIDEARAALVILAWFIEAEEAR